MGLRRQSAAEEASVQQVLLIRSPLRDQSAPAPYVHVDVRWWAESSLLFLVVLTVLFRLPDAPIADRVATLSCAMGCVGLAFIAVMSQHLHFCRVRIDTGLASGGTLVPLALLVQATQHPETPRWRATFWLAVAMTVSLLAWLVGVKVRAYLDRQVSDPRPRDSAIGTLSIFFLAWAQCTQLLGSPAPRVATFVSAVAMFGLICRGLASTLPQSFTLGEATLLVQTLVLLLQELCAEVAGEPTVLPSGGLPARFTACMLASAATLALTLLPSGLWASRRGKPDPPPHEHHHHRAAGQGGNGGVEAPLGAAMAVAVGVMAIPLTSAALGEDSVGWLIRYVGGSWGHLLTLGYWGVCLGVGLPVISAGSSALLDDDIPTPTETAGNHDEPRDPAALTDHRARQRRLRLAFRKTFHLLAILLFLPTLLIDPEFLGLSAGIALFLLIILECFRVAEVPPIAPAVNAAMGRYRDEKDPGELLTTHVYLLIACAAPVWISGPEAPPQMGGLGLVAVGVGDAVAAVVGCNLGRHRIFGTSKTVEGTLASAAAQIAAVAGLAAVGAAQCSLSNLVGAVVVGAAYEALTLQSDNLVVPLIVWVLAASGSEQPPT
eukprot:m.464462 g.464462  ORF g.464462 m.464462 type:complete len:605 (+) comp23520_c0_seq1:49-1863(+)